MILVLISRALCPTFHTRTWKFQIYYSRGGGGGRGGRLLDKNSAERTDDDTKHQLRAIKLVAHLPGIAARSDPEAVQLQLVEWNCQVHSLT